MKCCLTRIWSGLYEATSDYIYPRTYSDGTTVATSDLTQEAFPAYK